MDAAKCSTIFEQKRDGRYLTTVDLCRDRTPRISSCKRPTQLYITITFISSSISVGNLVIIVLQNSEAIDSFRHNGIKGAMTKINVCAKI